jgi:hypothetical protein
MASPKAKARMSTEMPPLQDRFIPKHIIYDKERLYEEVHELKIKLNQVRRENVQMKTKIAGSSVERGDRGMERDEEMGHRVRSHRQELGKKEELLSVALKKEIELLRRENDALMNEVRQLKRMQKYVQIHEL